MAIRPLEFTTLVCLDIQQVAHAKAVNSNLINQLKRGNFEIASTLFTIKLPERLVLCKAKNFA